MAEVKNSNSKKEVGKNKQGKNKIVIENGLTYQKTDSISDFSSLDVTKIRFSKVVSYNVGDTSIKYKRIYLRYQDGDKTCGDLFVTTPSMFTFGISSNSFDGKDCGKVLPLLFHDMNGPTKEQSNFEKKYMEIITHIQNRMIAESKKLNIGTLSEDAIRKMDPVYRKGKSPCLYAKLFTNNNEISTVFTFEGESMIIPRDGDRFNCSCILKFDNIYISGNKACLQIRVYQCNVEKMQNNLKPLFIKHKNDESDRQNLLDENSLSESD